jgi:hypothetical protein
LSCNIAGKLEYRALNPSQIADSIATGLLVAQPMDTVASHRPQRSAAVRNVTPQLEVGGGRQQVGGRRSERVSGSLTSISSFETPQRHYPVHSASKHSYSSKLSHMDEDMANTTGAQSRYSTCF